MTAHACEPHPEGTTSCGWCGLGFEPVDLDALPDSLSLVDHGGEVSLPMATLFRLVAEVRALRQWKSGAEVLIDGANAKLGDRP